MWHLEHELDPWFERVQQERDSKYGGPEQDEKVPMMDNEFADRMRKG